MEYVSDETFHGSYEIFQDPQFAQLYAATAGLDVVFRNGLVVITKKFPIIGYLNAMVGNPEVHASFSQWRKKVDVKQYAYLKVITSEHIDAWNEYCVSPPDTYNMLLDLSQGEEKLFAGFKRNCRKAIISGEKKGVVILESKSDMYLDDFYKIITHTSDKGKLFDIFSFQQYRGLLGSKYSKLFVAKYNNRVVGGNFLLLSHSAMHGWHSGIIRNNSFQIPIANILYFYCAKWGIMNRYRYFDFGVQCLHQNESILRFKLSFNPIFKKAYVYNVPGSKFKQLLISTRNKLRR